MPHTELHELFERHHQYRRQRNPEYATYEGDFRYNDLLTDMSAAAEAAEEKQLRAFKQELDAIAPASLSKTDQLNHEMFGMLLDEGIDGFRFKFWQMPINQMTGFQLSLPQLIDFQPLKTPDQYPDYCKRLKAFSKQIDDVIDNLKLGMAEKRVQPGYVIEQVLPQILSLIAGEATDSVFYLPITQNTDFTPGEKEKLGQGLAQVIDSAIKPAYQKLHDFLKETYLPACRETTGIWDLPDGEAMYQYFIKMYTTPDLDADTIHEMGLAEVERIHNEKEKLKKELGFTGDVEAFNRHLRTHSDFIFESPEALWESYQGVMAEAYEKVPALFKRMPNAPCVMKAVEDYKAKTAPQAYYMPAPEDGSRPGYYYLNTFDLPTRPTYAVTALTLHEAIPGHHLQIALAQELTELPYFRRNMHVTAYIEGWGLYSEYLGYEMDMYTDPYQHYGALSFEMWRACRLVVDTGIHAKRWTREQANQFMQKQMANSDHDIASEVDRYTILPGQALSYKVGEIKIKQLRAAAEKQLGERFDIKEFHDVVLRNGSVPLAVLEEEVDQWVAQA